MTEALSVSKLSPEGRKNPYLENFVSQVGSLDIKPRYLKLNYRVENEGPQRDSLTGLLLESDQTRRLITSRLKKAILEEQNFVCISNDADNLKGANTKVGRLFGDLIIRYGVKVVTEAIDGANLGEDVEIYLFKRQTAADETDAWIFGITSDQIETLKKNLDKIQDPKTIKNPDFTLSTTATLISSRDSLIQPDIEKTKNWFAIEPDSSKIPYELYQKIVDLTDDIIHRHKIVKDLARLEGENIVEIFSQINLDDLIKVFTEDFGDSRISGDLLGMLLKIVSVKATLTPLGKKGAIMFLHKIVPKGIKIPDDSTSILATYNKLFGKEE